MPAAFAPTRLSPRPREIGASSRTTGSGGSSRSATSVRLRISDPAPRCSVPTLAQEGLRKDPHVLRTIVEHNRVAVPALEGELLPCAGVYAFVIRGGTVKKGDAVRVGRQR